jgi:hypothetical protein
MRETHNAAGLASIGVVIPLVGNFVSALLCIRPLS